MGWSDCGTDSRGRGIGYGHAGRCDHPGCTTRIDRGLSFVCGNMHGEGVFSCEGYFCYEHHRYPDVPDHLLEAHEENWHGESGLCVSCCAAVEEHYRLNGDPVDPLCGTLWDLTFHANCVNGSLPLARRIDDRYQRHGRISRLRALVCRVVGHRWETVTHEFDVCGRCARVRRVFGDDWPSWEG